MDEMLTAAIAAFLARSRGGIQLNASEVDAARDAIANGARVVLTTTAKFGEGTETTYRIDLIREAL